MAIFYFTFGVVTVLVLLEVIAGYYILKTLRSLKENARCLESQMEHEARDRSEMYDDVNRKIDTVSHQLFIDIDTLRNDTQKILEEHKTNKGIIKG